MPVRTVPLSYVLVASVAVAAVLAALWPGGPPPAPSPTPAARTSGATARSAAPAPDELDELRDELDALWDAQGSGAAPPTEAPPAVDADAALAARRAVLAQRLETERVDPAWGPAATAELRAELDALGALVREVDTVECRATLCRVELHYDPLLVDPNNLADTLGALAPWPANGTFSVDLGDERSAWVYLSREGHVLPS